MMKKDSLIYKYKKAMKESENATNSEKKKIRYNFVTKLFFRIFLSSCRIFYNFQNLVYVKKRLRKESLFNIVFYQSIV